MTPRRTPPAALTSLEIASGVVVGTDIGTPPLPAYDHRSARAALEAAIRPALIRAPCVVSFSGGRDSSAMLALAVHVARREGLPMPVPVTVRFPGDAAAHEDEWQELVVSHLAVEDWQRITVDDELDLLGPFATSALRAHGALFPFNGYTYSPMFPFAKGGTMVTGLDGDGLLACWSSAAAGDVLARRRRAQPRDVLRLGLYAGPQLLRTAVYAHRLRRPHPWLTPDAEASSRRADATEIAEEPRHWDRRVDWWQRRRYLSLTTHFDDVLGAAAGVAMSHPLLDPAFLAAMSHLGGSHGPGDRTTVMRLLFADLLPDALLSRTSKAGFNTAFFNTYSRAFVARWDGGHVDPALVDRDRLRAAWSSPSPPNTTAMLLQATWLASEGRASAG